jgi:hypothetical protein
MKSQQTGERNLAAPDQGASLDWNTGGEGAAAEAAKSFLGLENVLLTRTKTLSGAGMYWEKMKLWCRRAEQFQRDQDFNPGSWVDDWRKINTCASKISKQNTWAARRPMKTKLRNEENRILGLWPTWARNI